jgi:imidazolonepropionase
MGVEIGSKAISHLEEISDEEIDRMSKSETVGILLPTTAYILRLKQPPARKMLDNGCIVALASDFNPNAYCYSMPLVMHLACINMRLTLNEALVACTINSAFALGLEDKKGSIERGKHADLVVIRAKRWEHLVYQLGCDRSLIQAVLLRGNVVHELKD